MHRALTTGPAPPWASLRHSPELPLQIHEVLLGQHHSWAGADDHGLAVLEIGRLQPPLRQLGKEQSLSGVETVPVPLPAQDYGPS